MADAKEEDFFLYLPDDFKEYMYKKLIWWPVCFSPPSKCFRGGFFWSREDDEPQRPSTLPEGAISNLNKIIRDLLYTSMQNWPDGPILVQIWAPITTKEGRSFLTTRNQPFSLMRLIGDRLDIEGLCGYRMICMDSKFDIDLDGGTSLPARVFKHQFPESTPNVEFYSITEYPQRHDVLRCGVRQSLAFPVFEFSTQRCVGVIEVVTPWKERLLICSGYFRNEIYEDFKMSRLKCSAVFDHGTVELDEDENEIRNLLKMVCDVHDLPLAQAWVPCKVSWPCRPLVDGGILRVSSYYHKDEDEDEDEDVYMFCAINSLFHLKNGVGVVGRAFLSTNMVFCRDVTQLSLTEYPLAHYARQARLSGCFTICLESNCTGNDVYVLEFFMPISNNADENPHTSLRKILETMRKNFSCLRVASREELGEELHIEEISIQNGEKLDPVQIPQTTISLPQLELAQSEVEVMQVDSLDQQSVNAMNTGSNVGGTEHNNFAITSESTVKVSKREGNKSGTVKTSKRDGNNSRVKIKIPLKDILENSELSLQKAAEKLEVSESTLKRACRGYGIKSWRLCTINEAGCSQPHDTMMQDAKDVTVDATFGDITMRFCLSLSSSFVEFQEEVSKRKRNLVAGTYDVIYVDEGKRVLISTDADLQDYMRRSRSPGQTSIEVLILPTWQSAAAAEENDWMQLLNVDQQNSHTTL